MLKVWEVDHHHSVLGVQGSPKELLFETSSPVKFVHTRGEVLKQLSSVTDTPFFMGWSVLQESAVLECLLQVQNNCGPGQDILKKVTVR